MRRYPTFRPRLVSTRQAAAGRKNLTKAHVMRKGRRGMRYRPRYLNRGLH